MVSQTCVGCSTSSRHKWKENHDKLAFGSDVEGKHVVGNGDQAYTNQTELT